MSKPVVGVIASGYLANVHPTHFNAEPHPQLPKEATASALDG